MTAGIASSLSFEPELDKQKEGKGSIDYTTLLLSPFFKKYFHYFHFLPPCPAFAYPIIKMYFISYKKKADSSELLFVIHPVNFQLVHI